MYPPPSSLTPEIDISIYIYWPYAPKILFSTYLMIITSTFRNASKSLKLYYEIALFLTGSLKLYYEITLFLTGSLAYYSVYESAESTSC